MNKYLEMLDRIETETIDEDFSADYCYDEETDTEIFMQVQISCDYSSNDPDSPFKGVIPDFDYVDIIYIDCNTNEIDCILYWDNEDEERDAEHHEMDVRQLILDSLAADELEIYHNKCKAVIDKAITAFKEQCRHEHNRYVDRFGGEYI